MGIDNTNNSNASSSWMEIVSKYNFSDPVKSWWQVINSVIPYLFLWAAMIWSLKISYLLTLFLSVIAAGFLIRIFIIFHDCGHGSFFKSQRLNRIIGVIAGLMTFTPYHKWHHDHKEHHATVGNLDKRGSGDVKTLTVEEFLKLPIVLQWFTGNIGFHHIYHLSPRIPNYKLPLCYKENAIFQDVQPITFFSSLRSLRLRLWDEKGKKFG